MAVAAAERTLEVQVGRTRAATEVKARAAVAALVAAAQAAWAEMVARVARAKGETEVGGSMVAAAGAVADGLEGRVDRKVAVELAEVPWAEVVLARVATARAATARGAWAEEATTAKVVGEMRVHRSHTR